MKHKARKLLSILLALVMAAGLLPSMSPQARADDAKGGTRAYTDGTFTELQMEINANSGETITLTKNYLCEDGFGDNGIHIGSGKTITIDLAGFRIDGMEKSRVFSVSGDLTIKDSSTSSTGKITGGRADNGGGIYVDKNAALTVESGTITGNSVPGNGGGIYVGENASLTVGGTITGNSASGAGGGIYVLGSLTMTGGVVERNETEGAGGGIFADAGSSADLTAVTITRNVAGSYGGGICVDKNADLTVVGGTITGNSAHGEGGGIYVLGSLTMTGGVVEDNVTEGAGGGILADAGSSADLTGVTIAKNIAGNYGGGVCVLSKNTVQIKSCSITGNEAGLDGGGIFLEDGSVSLQGGSSVSDNTALRGGGVFIDTSAESVGIEGRLTITGNTASWYGSDVFLASGKKLTCTDELLEGTAIGVELEDGAGVFTKDYGTKNASVEPSAYFTVKETYRLFRNGDGEAEIALRLKTIHLAESGAAPNIFGGQQSGVYFGNYKQSPDGSGDFNKDPIKWRVLSNAEGKLFLLSDQNLDVMRYHNDHESVTWEKSTMRSWLNGYAASENNGDVGNDKAANAGIDYSGDNFIKDAFVAEEQTAIASTNVVNGNNPDHHTPGGNNTTDKVFLLSRDEAGNSGYGYGFVDSNSRISTNTAYVAGGGKINSIGMSGVGAADVWWLRSPGYNDGRAAYMFKGGSVYSNGSDVNGDGFAVRPAFHLNLNSVLFTSAAAGGKAGKLGTLSEIGDYAGREWKLTLKDESRKFAVTETAATAAPGGTVTLHYTGATLYEPPTDPNVPKIPNEYISVILTDENGNLLYYGRLALTTTVDDKVDVTIPADLAEGTYNLKVFSEQYNGDLFTDYASEFQDVKLTVASVTKYDLWLGGTQVDENNRDDILDDGGKAKYDPATGTLTLNDPSITTLNSENAVIFCAVDGPFTVEGTATLNVTGAEYGLRYQGAGDLTVNGDISATGVNGGIFAPNANIRITGGEVSATASGNNTTALNTEGKLTVTGGKLTANAISGGQNVGVYAQGGLEITGGELTAQGNQYGISVGESADITFANGTKAVWAMGNGSAVTMGNGVISIGDRLELRLPEDSRYHPIAGVELNDDKNQVLDGSGKAAKVVNLLPVRFTVTFDPNGGSVTPTSDTTGTDGKLTSLPTPTRSGSYRFDGWYTEKAGGTRVDESYAFSGNTTIYARWTYTGGGSSGGGGGGPVTPTQYTLTYQTNGGSAVAATRHNSGATVDLTAAPTRDGFTFDGWYADAALTSKITSIKMDGDKTVYAGWKETGPVTPGHDCPSAHLKDVDENAWYHEYIDYVVEKGLMQGVADDLFGPNVTTSRAMLVTILYRLEGSPAVSGASPFADVASGQWYTDAIIWANSKGIVQGYGGGRFGTDDNITREQFAAILYRYAKFKGYDVSVGQDTNILSYDDAFEVSEWAMEAMQWAVGSGLITGRTETTLVPRGDATRAEAAAILMRFCENVR